MTPPPDRNQGADQGSGPAPSGLSYVELDTRQMVLDVGTKVEVLGSDIKHLVKDREQDRGDARGDITELRSDLSVLRDDVRDRLARLEVRVDALPSKVWIGSVVLGGMAAIGVFCALITLLIRISAGH